MSSLSSPYPTACLRKLCQWEAIQPWLLVITANSCKIFIQFGFVPLRSWVKNQFLTFVVEGIEIDLHRLGGELEKVPDLEIVPCELRKSTRFSSTQLSRANE